MIQSTSISVRAASRALVALGVAGGMLALSVADSSAQVLRRGAQGAVVGGVIGAITGGGKGAGKGAAIGAAVRDTGHPALLFVDAVSSLAATDLRHDEWGLDVTISGTVSVVEESSTGTVNGLRGMLSSRSVIASVSLQE